MPFTGRAENFGKPYLWSVWRPEIESVTSPSLVKSVAPSFCRESVGRGESFFTNAEVSKPCTFGGFFVVVETKVRIFEVLHRIYDSVRTRLALKCAYTTKMSFFGERTKFFQNASTRNRKKKWEPPTPPLAKVHMKDFISLLR